MRTELGLVLTLAVGGLLAYVGLAVTVSGHDKLPGAVLLLTGIWAVVSAAPVHNQLHVERGEPAHGLAGWRPRRRRPRS